MAEDYGGTYLPIIDIAIGFAQMALSPENLS